jgi:archaellum biogenesis ATPase FlaH
MDYDEEKYNKNLHLLGLTPRLLTPGRLFYLITETIKENWREDRDCIVILDGGSAIERHFTPEDYMELMRSLIQYFKANNVTFIVTSLHNLFHEKVMISTLSDILIATWFDTRGDEIVRMLAILKERGSPHDRRKRKMFLSNGKVIIK